MKPKLNGLMGVYKIGDPLEGQSVPVVVQVFIDGIAIEMWKMQTKKNKVIIRKKLKQFDYKDLILMNDTIAKIMRMKR